MNDIGKTRETTFEERAGWARFEIVHCRDGKARRFEPGSFPLAHGVPGRVGLLRGYGNAIVPQVAAEFIQALMSIK
jgi:DNA (cytosine-5)-methyltransferase 1